VIGELIPQSQTSSEKMLVSAEARLFTLLEGGHCTLEAEQLIVTFISRHAAWAEEAPGKKRY